METIELSYNGVLVPFTKGEKVFQKITPVARNFGVEIKDYFRGKERQLYYETICKANNLTISNQANLPLYNTSDFANTFPDLVVTEKGRYGGTWIRQEVIIDFARWLSPEFAVWCDNKIKELLQQGHTEMKPEDINEVQVIKRMADYLVTVDKKLRSQDKQIRELSEHIKKSEKKRKTRNDYYSVAGFAYFKSIHINHDKAKEIKESAKSKCMDRKIATDNYIHHIYGKVDLFPREILNETFRELF